MLNKSIGDDSVSVYANTVDFIKRPFVNFQACKDFFPFKSYAV
jgi:hypothetical protein